MKTLPPHNCSECGIRLTKKHLIEEKRMMEGFRLLTYKCPKCGTINMILTKK